MGRISAQIELVDRMTGTLQSITSALTATTTAAQNLTGSMQGLQSAMGGSGASDMEQATAQTAQNTQEMAQNTNKATDAQEKLNEALNDGVNGSNRLWDAVKKIGTAYLSMQGIQKMVSASDDLVSTTARLNVMSETFAAANKEAATTDDLVRQVYAAAQDARGSFSDMAAVVAKFGNNAGDAFSSTDEVVRFANLIQKQMAIAGASTQEASNAMLQLSQALGSGVLRGDELNSIFEQAPNLIKNIANYMGVSIGQIRELASEGRITADIVKNAMFDAAKDIDEQFEAMPMTWSQVMASLKNTALMAFQPILDKVNELANNEDFQRFADGIIQGAAAIGTAILDAVEFMSEYSEIFLAVAAAIVAYSTAASIAAKAQLAYNAATKAAAVAQSVLNAAIWANPLTWVVALIAAIVVAIAAVCVRFAMMQGAASSAFGAIAGYANIGIQTAKNLGLTIINICAAIGNVIGALANNISVAFDNAISGVQTMFYNLLATACNVIAGIAEQLNKLPFVEFDYSGLVSAADAYAGKAAEIAASKGEYVSIADAFSEGMATYDTFQDGWKAQAFADGAAWGDGVSEKVSGLFSGGSDLTNGADLSFLDMYSLGDSAAATAANTADAANSAGSIADSVAISSENLKYLRDIAETEAINRFTTAEIQVAMTNNNNVSSSIDIDGMVDTLSAGVLEAMEMAAEGVH